MIDRSRRVLYRLLDPTVAVDGEPVPIVGKQLPFTLLKTGRTTLAQYIGKRQLAEPTDEDGYGYIDLWCNEDGDTATTWVVGWRQGETSPEFTVPYGDGSPIQLTAVLTLGIGAETPQGESVLAIVEGLIDAAIEDVTADAVAATATANTAAGAADTARLSLVSDVNAALDTLEDALEASIAQTLLAAAATEDAVTQTALTVTATGEANDARDQALAAASYAIAYDIPFRVDGPPAANDVILHFIAVRPFSLPAGLLGSLTTADIAATAEDILSVTKNGVEIGTLTFAAASDDATPASAAGASFVAGDVLKVTNQAVQDTTLANLRGTLKGTMP